MEEKVQQIQSESLLQDLQITRVYDIECLYDFFCVTFIARDSDEEHHFRIWQGINEVLALSEFLETYCLGLVGFNNLKYDWPILNYIYWAKKKLCKLPGQQAARLIQEFSSKILDQKFSEIRNPFIPQLDVFRIWHFDNKNKAVSLKALEIAMNWPLVADMPVHHTEYIDTEEKALKVQEYNRNDTLCTKRFLQLSKEEIDLRKSLSEIYNLNLLNANDAKMGELIILNKIAEAMKAPIEVIKAMNTTRDSLAIKDCLLPIEFTSEPLTKAYNAFENFVVDTRLREEGEKKAEKEEDLYSCIYDGVRYDFGLGGLHALRTSGVYQEDENNLIISADVSSYYGNLAIGYGFAPQHLGEFFSGPYKSTYQERKKHKKGTPANKGLKQVIVSVFGKSKDRYSFLYDPKYTYQITVNGQLLLAKLCEDITSIGGQIIMANTDGIEFLISREKYEIGMVKNIFDNWELETGLTLEEKRYKKLFIRDVNNYIGEFLEPTMPYGQTYNKGAYEWKKYDEEGNLAMKWEKDHSMLCVPYAVEKYLTHGQSIRKSFDECDMWKFMIGKRAKSGGNFEIRSVANEGDDGGFVRKIEFGKTIRYMISIRGGYLFKWGENSKKASRIDSPWKVLNCMDLRDIDVESLREMVDYRYYEAEVKKLLAPIINKQITYV